MEGMKYASTRYKSSSPNSASSYTNNLLELCYSASTIGPSSFSPDTPIGHLPLFPNDIAALIGAETMDKLVAGMTDDFGDNSSSSEYDFLGSMLRTRRAVLHLQERKARGNAGSNQYDTLISVSRARAVYPRASTILLDNGLSAGGLYLSSLYTDLSHPP